MNPAIKWLLWALALLVMVGITDFIAFAIGASTANGLSVKSAGNIVIALLLGYLVVAVSVTAAFWWLGRGVAAGPRTVGVIVFLLAQGLVCAFMSLMTLLGSNR
ncbi:hypothetical protein [Lysobacter fragariae]